MEQTTSRRDYWKPREVAELYRVSVSAVMKWIHARQIGALRLPNNRYLIPETEVERIKNSTFLPEARLTAEDYTRREEDRERRSKAALARLRRFSVRKQSRLEQVPNNTKQHSEQQKETRE